MKKLACLLLLLLLAGCIPIGLKSSSLPFQSLFLEERNAKPNGENGAGAPF